MFDAKKLRHEDFTSLTDDPELSMLDTLPKEAICSKLRAALDFAKSQHTRIMKLEAELMDVKLAFADSMTLRYIKQRSVSPVEPSQVESVLMGKCSYSQAVKGHQAPVLVATFTSYIKPANRISPAGVEELLGSSGGPSSCFGQTKREQHLHQADLDRPKTILESRAGPDSINVFNSVSRPSKLYPAVALFVNLSYLPSLKEELMVLLKSCSTARNPEIRSWLVGYGHIQVSCRASSPSCGKCALAQVTTLLVTVTARPEIVLTVAMPTNLGTFRFISVYLRPPIHNIAGQFNSDLSCLFTKLSIIAIHSNSLSKVWNSKLTNSRGIELELLIAKHFLCILNRPLSELEFVPASTSFIDISLAGSAITSSRWFYPTIPSFSDHPYIYFESVSTNISDLFSALRVASDKSANISLPSNISIEGSVISDPTAILKNLVNTLAKILEKLALNRLLWHSSTAQWLSPNQHGFTQGKSTKTATHSLISFRDAAKETKCVTACAFLDIKSAFDTAWHPAIMSALVDRKCPRYLIHLIYCFLSDRTAILSLDNTVSSFHVGLGCPQGGVPSPFLWSVLVGDALRLQFSFPSLIVGCADDLTVATYHKDPLIATRNFQSMCDGVNNWCLVNKLALNASKSIFMIICKKIFNWSHLSISINDLRIFPSAETLFLRLTIDCRLKWHSYISNKIAAAQRAFSALRSSLKSTWSYDRKRLKYIYLSAVEPILLYGCSVLPPFLSTKKESSNFMHFSAPLLSL
ncbi:Uncharacterized protein APZ42_033521 [Daphnia magna]|uniref:Reverse transcriptase domain-containing protein n=1 Tax=Daphnia magna TaxID=35525 RepID=A0A164L087_9CRUS|nr:Uncharacterized protein APZ42_033521 [Daphnia magna]